MRFKRKIYFFILNLILVYIACINILKHQLLPNILKYGEYQCENISTKLINYTIEKNITEELKRKIVTYTDEEFTLIDFNTAILNSIMSKFIKELHIYYNQLSNGKIDDDLAKYLTSVNENNIYRVPMSLALKNPFISTFGPEVPIKYRILNEINGYIESNLKEYGINSALLEINLNVSVDMTVDIPIFSEEKSINMSIPLVIKIIQGKIPEAFYGKNIIGGTK